MNRLPNILMLIAVTCCGCEGRPPQMEEVSASVNWQSDAEPIQIVADDWPMWRGTRQNGVAADQSAPTSWSESENVVWKSNVPGRGHSSPMIIGQLVVVSTADEDEETQSVIAYDRATGDRKWSTVVNTGELPRMHRKNSHASATLASDGHLLFVAFVNHQQLEVAALDFDGNIVWDETAGFFRSEHGYGSSPTLYGDYVIVSGDSKGLGFLAAHDRATGNVAWRTNRTAGERHGSYATPIVAELNGRPQLIQSGYGQTISYDPATGKEIWSVAGPATVMANTVAFSDPYVVVSGGYPQKSTLCIRVDGSEEVVWSSSRSSAYVTSPLIADDQVIIVTNDGIVVAYELETGDRKWQERMGGNYSASPIQVGNAIYVPDEQGTIHVFEAGDQFRLIAKNRLESEGGMATLAVADDRLFVRTGDSLYCIGSTTQQLAVDSD